MLRAQNPSQQDQEPTAPVQLPLSGRTPGVGTVTETQRTAETSPPGSVQVLQDTLTVQPPFNGSLPQVPLRAGGLHLSLEDALAMGMRYNLGAAAQSAAVMQARGERLIARSSLLPNLNAAGSEELEQLNLRTEGVTLPAVPTSVEFSFFDVRAAKLKQTVFDLVSINNLHSSSAGVKAQLSAVKNARDLIVLAVGGSFLRLYATHARIESAKAEVDAAATVAKQADDRFSAGLAPHIDVSRARVQLQTEQERLRSLQGDFDTQKLALARIIGLAPGQKFDITGDYPYTPLNSYDPDGAVKTAVAQRADLVAATAAVHAAEFAVKAAHAERLPNVKVSADVGVAGLRPTSNVSAVYSVAGTVTVPIFEGGRIAGDVEVANAALRQRQAEMADIRGQIDYDVRQAMIQLQTAADQVGVAGSNVDLAHETLTQSQDRFVAGVADTVEVVQAEQAVVQADDDLITAVYEHNLAKVSLARALGNSEQMLPQLLRHP